MTDTNDHMTEQGLWVQTPIDTFKHPESGSTIEVVSTMHVGERQYYRSLYRHLDQRLDEGFTVLTEGIKASSAEETDSLSPLDRLKTRMIGRQAIREGLLLELVTEKSRFVSQYYLDDLMAETDYADQIVKVDMTQADIAQDRGLLGLLHSSFGTYAQYHRFRRRQSADPNDFDGLIYEEIRKQAAEAGAEKSSVLKEPGRGVIIDGRNQRVVDAIDNLVEDDPAAHIALLWGLGHRAGLISEIQERKYENTGKSSLMVAFKPLQPY